MGCGRATHRRRARRTFRCYASAKLAALFNPLSERIRLPRLWEVAIDRDVDPTEGVLLADEVKAVAQANLPSASAQDYARFAVLCAQKAASDSPEALEFSQWVEIWRAGMDNSGVQARAIADMLESAADIGAGLAQQEEMMAAHAARAAVHAARRRGSRGEPETKRSRGASSSPPSCRARQAAGSTGPDGACRPGAQVERRARPVAALSRGALLYFESSPA